MQAKSSQPRLPLIAGWMGRKPLNLIPGVTVIAGLEKRGRLHPDVEHSGFAFPARFNVPKPIYFFTGFAGKTGLFFTGRPGAAEVVAELNLRASDHLVYCRNGPAGTWVVDEVKHFAAGAIWSRQIPCTP